MDLPRLEGPGVWDVIRTKPDASQLIWLLERGAPATSLTQERNEHPQRWIGRMCLSEIGMFPALGQEQTQRILPLICCKSVNKCACHVVLPVLPR